MPTVQYNVGLEWSNAPGGPGVNTWHIRYDSVVGDLESALSALATFYDSIRGVLPTGVRYRFTDHAVTVGDSPTYVPVSNAATNTGSGGATYLPMATAMCVSWKTTAATRSGRGRTFIGPLSNLATEANGTPAPEAITLLQNAATALVNASLVDNGWGFGVYSRKDGVLRDFTRATVRDVFAVLRSRRG